MRKTIFSLLVCTCVVAAQAAVGAGADKRVKLSGCLIRGDGDGAGYLLVNPPTEPWLSSPDKQVTPSVLGTSGDYATIFYWLDGHGDLKQQVGHKVEVEGDLKGDVKDGEIATERKDNWTEVTVKADGRTDEGPSAQRVHVSSFRAGQVSQERHPGSQGRCGARAHAGGDVLVAVWYLNDVRS